MIDQLVIGDKASFDDFAASVATRKIKTPAKKKIKETVPFSNVTYDFSAINGEAYWEERKLEYVFEIIADDPEELEELKTIFACWVMNIQEEELHDPFIPDYHFKATFDEVSFEDDEGMEKTTATVIFTAYPFKIANLPKVYVFELTNGVSQTVTIYNNSAHNVYPVFSVTGAAVIVTFDNGTTNYWEQDETGDEGITNSDFVLHSGVNTLALRSYGQGSKLTVRFYEEVF